MFTARIFFTRHGAYIMAASACARALLIGCNYPESDLRLKGRVERMHHVRDRLLENEDVVWNVKMLCDEWGDDDCYPTTSRIIHEILALAAWTRGREGRVCLVWFNGRGMGGERDNLLVPCDYEILGYPFGADTFLSLLQTFAFDSTILVVLDCFQTCDVRGLLDHAHEGWAIKADIRLLWREGGGENVANDSGDDVLSSAMMDMSFDATQSVGSVMEMVNSHLAGYASAGESVCAQFISSRNGEECFFPMKMW